MTLRNKALVGAALAMCLVFAARETGAQTNTPILDQAYAGSLSISGKAAPKSGPIKIYDISYPTRAPISQGKTSMDDAGNFAMALKVPLAAGHQIVAEDKDKRVSAPIAVKPPDSATAPQ